MKEGHGLQRGGDAKRPGMLREVGFAVNAPDLETLYAEHAGFVWRVLRGMGVHESSVPDAVQDVFIVVHRRYPEFNHRAKVSTWLFEIAYRIASDYRRKQTRASRLFAPQEDNIRSADDRPDERAQQSEEVRLLAQLLDRLDEDKRAVLILSDVEGLTAVEIAEATNTNLNTVYSRLRRARSELNELVAAHDRRRK